MHRGIALLITLMFVMLISVAIGYGLSQMKRASKIVQDENLLYKSSMVLDDVLTILQTSPDMRRLADSNSSDELYIFLQSSSYLPLDIADEKIILSFSSARSKLNINSLKRKNEGLFREFFNRHMVSSSYVDILKDCMRKNQAKDEYNNYSSTLFDQMPTLFRDYIASKKHLDMINDFYLQEYGDTNIAKLPFAELFRYSENEHEAIDLNYATVAVWELILSASKERAEQLYAAEGSYKSLEDLKLTPSEKVNISRFETSFFEPYLLVEIEIIRDESISKIRFIYDIKLKKGYDFVFEV